MLWLYKFNPGVDTKLRFLILISNYYYYYFFCWGGYEKIMKIHFIMEIYLLFLFAVMFYTYKNEPVLIIL